MLVMQLCLLFVEQYKLKNTVNTYSNLFSEKIQYRARSEMDVKYNLGLQK